MVESYFAPQFIPQTGGTGVGMNAIPDVYGPPTPDWMANGQSAPGSGGGWLSGIFGRGGNTPGAPGSDSSGFGWNLGTGRLAFAGLGTLASLWSGMQAQKLAKESLAFTRDVTNTNMRNQLQTYNTNLEDRIRARAATEGMSQQEVDSYLARNRLTR